MKVDGAILVTIFLFRRKTQNYAQVRVLVNLTVIRAESERRNYQCYLEYHQRYSSYTYIWPSFKSKFRCKTYTGT